MTSQEKTDYSVSALIERALRERQAAEAKAREDEENQRVAAWNVWKRAHGGKWVFTADGKAITTDISVKTIQDLAPKFFADTIMAALRATIPGITAVNYLQYEDDSCYRLTVAVDTKQSESSGVSVTQ